MLCAGLCAVGLGLGACPDRPSPKAAKAVPVSDPASLSPGAMGAPDPAVATIGEEAIPASELRKEFLRTKNEYRHVRAHEAPSWDVLKTALLDKMLERRRLLAEAKRRGVKVSDADLEDAFLLSHSCYDRDRFEETLLELGQTVTQFKDGLREKLTIEGVLREVFRSITVSDDEGRAKYQAAPAKYTLPEAVRALHIAVRTEPEARRLRKQLVDNEEPFEKLAKTNSVSPDSQQGGDLGFFARGQKPKVFEETCFRLEPGKISPVTPSEHAYHLFKVVEKRAAKPRSFEEAKPTLLRELRAEKQRAAEDAFRQELETRMPAKIDAAILKRIR